MAVHSLECFDWIWCPDVSNTHTEIHTILDVPVSGIKVAHGMPSVHSNAEVQCICYIMYTCQSLNVA